MTETKSNPITGAPAINELLKEFENEEFENVDLKAIELAVEQTELQLKNIRRALKVCRRQLKTKKSSAEVLKG